MSAGAMVAVQQAIFTLLRGDAGLAALLANSIIGGDTANKAVYDVPPQVADSASDSAFPYLVIGDRTVAEFATDDVDGQEHTVTIHAWVRAHGKKTVLQVLDAVYAALHDASLTVTGHSAVFCFFEFSGLVPDENPKVQHGAIRFRIVTQDT